MLVGFSMSSDPMVILSRCQMSFASLYREKIGLLLRVCLNHYLKRFLLGMEVVSRSKPGLTVAPLAPFA